MSPASKAPLSAAKGATKRRLKPIITGRPAWAATAWQASARSRARSTGFSHTTALPACSAASISPPWGAGGGGGVEVQVCRFVAQHGLAGMHRRFDQRRMGVGGGGDQYRIDAGVGDD